MAIDPQILQHREWLGLLQPVGLVVSPVALVSAEATIDRSQLVKLQERLQILLEQLATPEFSTMQGEEGWRDCVDFPRLAEYVLEWLPEDLVTDLPEEMAVPLPEYGEILKPTYGVRDPDSKDWIMLVQTVMPGQKLDDFLPDAEKGWKATVHQRFERLLRETQIPTGILWNGVELRLVYAPRGESSGHLTFPIEVMSQVSGRLILGAMELLLGADRLFGVSSDRRLPKILEKSREYQSEVSEKLADQVVDALWELLRGFQMADAAVNQTLLAEDPTHLYGGLITTLMRLVFLLYAEDEGLMPDEPVYQCYYSVSGLYERLREDAGNYPDTMDDRYGAWAWLLSLFRLVYDGGGATPEYLPARHGQLFDPSEYPFLEGNNRRTDGRYEVPRIPDGVVYRMLDKLLILDGERLSYRSLDVSNIGSVYEGIMGYTVERSTSLSIGVNSKPKGSKISTTVVIDVEALLAAKSSDRAKLLKEWANCELSGSTAKAVKEATNPTELAAALGRKRSSRTLDLLNVGSFYLQPTEERRRSGSHYTPRKLTQPIVETTLRPIFEGLGEIPTAAQILELKVCDLAMGSGAFLVEACQQLAEALVEAWNREGLPVELPEGEDPLSYARRLVAQRCIYGVDKNPFAVNLAKLSLWLFTLSKALPFTFLDHALKCGDSLIGLRKAEIGSFGRDPNAELPLMQLLTQQVDRAKSFRSEIQAHDTRSDADDDHKREQWQDAERAIKEARLTSDLMISAFFEGSSKKERQERSTEYAALIGHWRSQGSENVGNNATDFGISSIAWKLRNQKGVVPFNWEVEFPEVFDRENPGFDCIIGNPPFAGKNTIINGNPENYLEWLKENYPESHGNSDLVAYFFRRSFDLLRQGGTFGLIATNTIAQGDTRSTGLRWICQHKGTIYHAQKRVRWAGQAAVVVSVINVFKGQYNGTKQLDGKEAPLISAFLFPKGDSENPKVLLANAEKSFKGSVILGIGFTFDATNENASSISEMNRLIEKDQCNAQRIFPYIGGEEVNSSPTHSHRRYVINFGEMSEDEARNYPDLMAIVEDKVKPERLRQKREIRARYWWRFGETTPALFRAISPLDRVLVCAQTSKYRTFTFLAPHYVFDQKLVVFALSQYSAFATLHSRIHEVWAIFFGSSMKDDPVYTPSDCFQTFPFPPNWETDPTLATIGKQYYEYRAELMIRNNQGLTDTYNRFHDPNETDPDILTLRDLHEKLDRAVLDAYGWHDLPTDCEFRLDYEDEDPDSTSKRKKPWRYRWAEPLHDEVLARLLDLNQQRHQQEILGGDRAEKKSKGQKTRGKKSETLKNQTSEQLNLEIT
ncbi:MAG: N-6 DNA methylase [Leptolyngbya sp. UWPOB_LEPTO1]|uniref:Eco57I restriction-modification methylase domain-containing protein n=1 Tax=Leptolyngbya sp. UWPOB_LEPTO1 TaxID=2815653 RepID=UPI001ACF8957|nr:DNA methyltransferase [Leptolyngbya sp. UWPOB_LEPTO1]MBN8563492.1 N-6 DNA methylase [Leptolyngbya sp. UWPOB_LEPTO1]